MKLVGTIGASVAIIVFAGIILGVIGVATGVIKMGGGDVALSFGDNSGGSDDSDLGGVLGQLQVEKGTSASVAINSYVGSWGGVGSSIEVYPEYTIKDDKNNMVTNDAAANTTSSSVGRTLNLWCTGTSYYCDPQVAVVDEAGDAFDDIDAYTVASVANGLITVYDEDENALTADDNDNNTADYAGGSIGAADNQVYFVKYSVDAADVTRRIGAFLTWYCGDEIDDYTMVQPGWVEVDVPSGDLDKTFTMYDDTNATISCSIKHAYVPTGTYMQLNENGDTGKLKTALDTDDDTGPSANGDSYFGGVFVDYGCEQDQNKVVKCDWFKHSTSNDPDDIGVSEAVVTSGYKGLDTGFAVEPQ